MAKTRSQEEDTKGKGVVSEDSTEQRIARLEEMAVEKKQQFAAILGMLSRLQGIQESDRWLSNSIGCELEIDKTDNDEELVESEVATESIKTEHGIVKPEANANMILANLEEEPISQLQVPVSKLEPSLRFHNASPVVCEDFKSLVGFDGLFDHVKVRAELVTKSTSVTNNQAAHQLFDKMSLRVQSKRRQIKCHKSWRFKFKHRVAPRDSKSGDSSDFWRFDGDKIKEWLFKVEKFFSNDFIPMELKVKLASNHFDGDAANWHQSQVQTGQFGHLLADWGAYKVLLKERFENVFEDSIAKLKQLQETREVRDEIEPVTDKEKLVMPQIVVNANLGFSDYNNKRMKGTREKLGCEIKSAGLTRVSVTGGNKLRVLGLKKVEPITWRFKKMEKRLLRQFQELFEKPNLASMMFEQTFSSFTEPERILSSFFHLKHKWRFRLLELFSRLVVLAWINLWFSKAYEFSGQLQDSSKGEAVSFPFLNFAAGQHLLWRQNNSEPILIVSELERNKKPCYKTWMFKYKVDEEDQGILQSRTGWVQEVYDVIRFLLRRHLHLNLDCEEPESAGRKRNHGLFIRLHSKQKQQKCPKSWMYKFKMDSEPAETSYLRRHKECGICAQIRIEKKQSKLLLLSLCLSFIGRAMLRVTVKQRKHSKTWSFKYKQQGNFRLLRCVGKGTRKDSVTVTSCRSYGLGKKFLLLNLEVKVSLRGKI